MRLTRDPVVLVQGLIIPILMTIVLVLKLSTDTTGLVDALLLAIGGAIAALGVSVDALLPLLGGLAKASLAVLLAFGVHLGVEWQTMILSILAIVVAFLTRPQVTSRVPASPPVIMPVAPPVP